MATGQTSAIYVAANLVGQTISGEWVVIEAKGRSNSFDPVGEEPTLRIGMVTHFGNGHNERLQFRASHAHCIIPAA
jgi:hypothetical protein